MAVNRLLKPISRVEISSFAKRLREPWSTLTAITLIDGETIVGHLGGAPGPDIDIFTPPTRKQWRYFFNKDLIISYRDLYRELRCYIPIKDIAGIRIIDITQPKYSSFRIDEARGEVLTPRDEYLDQFEDSERALRSAIRERRQADFERERARHFDQLRKSIQSSASESTDERQKLVEDELRNFEFHVLERGLIPLLQATALKTALGHDYQVTRWWIGALYSLTSTVSFTGDFEPKPGERLYVDWEYVLRNREGINGAGFGYIASLSLQWNTSDARAARKLTKNRLIDLRDVCLNRLALVRGYIAFLDVPGSMIGHDAMSSGHELSMDGATWRAAIICDRPIAAAPARGVPWVLSYWKEGCDEVPFQMLDTSVPPLEIFGSVHSGRSNTSFGDASCFFKVHFAQAGER